jgi:hypothetical protein
VYYHRIGTTQMFEQSYSNTVREIHMNDDYVALLLDSKCVLHSLENNERTKDFGGMKVFPAKEEVKHC